jgi:hypothetical protein
MIIQTDLFAASVRQPLVVCCGVGRDSVAMLIGLFLRGIKPDLIMFADVGAEREETYAYIPILNSWLRSIGWPELTIVVYKCKKFKHWPHYFTLEENLLTNCVLAGISYGNSTCSAKWKILAQAQFLRTWQPAVDCWSAGGKIIKLIGFDASPRELRRAQGCNTYAFKEDELDKCEIQFPLQEWGWDLKRCISEIEKAGLPVPVKSSCYFCNAMKPWEVDGLSKEKLKRLVIIEARAKPYLRTVKGIWRSAIKGFRMTKKGPKPTGATARPASITEYIRAKSLLPACEVERLIAATPTRKFSKADFDRLGFSNWQAWINSITNDEQHRKEPVQDGSVLRQSAA